jgi:hypothetical protein
VLFYLVYLATAGVWVFLIWNSQDTTEHEYYSFFEIVKFRIAHHFIPAYFPLKHIIVLGALYILALLKFRKDNTFLLYFFIISMLGIGIYLIGINNRSNLILSTQWMKVNIWLKFFSVLAFMLFMKSIFDRRYYRIIILVIFIFSLIISIFRFSPIYDQEVPENLYGWISLQTEKDDVFLVPPTLLDFKSKTLRSSYFDFKAMLHHRPAIYNWAERFEKTYGIEIGHRTPNEHFFKNIENGYLNHIKAELISNVDYIIVPKAMKKRLNKIEFQKIVNEVYIDDKFVLFEVVN